ncbi:hypothetical protein R8Z57_13100 [Microbacterium sp. M3]|uniref:Cation-transporting ATPase n=1 Tax=Microbacterium arthrosphaerae TaxID=792652 RepID=A0ABU4H300_9MICO|nr:MULTISPECIES: hypothetical protein [Microbacterium]MDW4573711.1 hypothetical protein [Microbacterium arthrosphaerae]MDW7607566.1 hypothetical protein [Microbacterium sp. M3]
MSSLNRLFGLAAKALDSSNSSSSSSSRGGSRDWRDMVRDAAAAVTGDTRPAANPGQSGPQPGGQAYPGHQSHPSAQQQYPGAQQQYPGAQQQYPGAQQHPGAQQQYPGHQSYPGAQPQYPGGQSYPGAQGYSAPGGPGYSAPGAPAPVSGVGMTPPPAGTAAGAPSAADRAAIARYEYLLQTSDPHQVEAIHREAFARLTPEQRAQVQAGMRAELRPAEQPRSADAPDLARAAARTEAARPGAMAGLLARIGRGSRGRSGSGMGRSAALVGAGGLLGAVAGGAVVSAVAAPLLANAVASGIDFDAIAGGVDLDAIAGGVDLEGLAGGVDLGGVGDVVAGAGDTVTGFGEQLSNFEIPGLGDFFGR